MQRSLRSSVALAFALVPLGCREPAPAEPSPGRVAVHASAAPVAAGAPRHPARLTLVPDGEPGEALEVTGTVFQPDGVTPAPGVTIYLYQTDATGVYSTPFLAGAGETPRLRGWLQSDAMGNYSFRTIRPAPYPGRSIAAHIHFQLWSERWPAQYAEDIQFADDDLLTEREREQSQKMGRFGPVKPVTRGEDGVWRCAHDMRLQPSGDEFEGNTTHGRRDEPLARR